MDSGTMKDAMTRLSCGAVVVRETESGWVTLMLRAYKNWDFPKGLCEDGERPKDAAIREIGEETGIHNPDFAWGDRHIETGPYHRGKIARYYLAKTGQEEVEMGISPLLGRPEHHEYRWVSFDEAHDLAAPRVRQIVRWARQIVGT